MSQKLYCSLRPKPGPITTIQTIKICLSLYNVAKTFTLFPTVMCKHLVGQLPRLVL